MTGLITASGRQFDDWTADYRLLSRERLAPGAVFDVIRSGVLDRLGGGAPLVVAMDDTTSRKKGRKIPGAGWRRDPMSPPFRTQFLWGRRFLQISAILPAQREAAPSRAIPIAFSLAPSPRKPSKRDPDEAWAAYREACRNESLSMQGVRQLAELRENLDREAGDPRTVRCVADGSYTNRTVLRQLPPKTTLIGRVRADARLHRLPGPVNSRKRGRRPSYGAALPTPEQIRQDPAIPWHTARIYAAGKLHQMRYKTVGPVLWRAAGAGVPLRLAVIAPLAYRPSRGSKLLYRHPAYLVCSDPALCAEEILAAYVGRWDIEVNFRDEKQLVGFDEAQVRTEPSARNAPALAVSAYAILLLAAVRAFGVNGVPTALPPPKWRQRHPPPRPSTASLMNQLRHDLWARAIGHRNFSRFVNTSAPDTKPEKCLPNLPSFLFYAQPAA